MPVRTWSISFIPHSQKCHSLNKQVMATGYRWNMLIITTVTLVKLRCAEIPLLCLALYERHDGTHATVHRRVTGDAVETEAHKP